MSEASATFHISSLPTHTKLSCFTASNTGPFINLKVQRKVSVQDICIAQVNLVQPCGAIVHCGAHHPDLPLSTIIQLSLPSLNHLCQFLSSHHPDLHLTTISASLTPISIKLPSSRSFKPQMFPLAQLCLNNSGNIN